MPKAFKPVAVSNRKVPHINYQSSWIRQLRRIVRKTGLLPLLRPFVARKHEEYEQAFKSSLRAAIQPGHTVWDIGANVGFYTVHFLEWVGLEGKVVAFEPLPRAYAELTRSAAICPSKAEFIGLPMAISNEAGQAVLAGDSNGDDITTTAQLSGKDTAPRSGIVVDVTTVDAVMAERLLPQPNVVKIDVEGFEEEVLEGGAIVFGHAECRHIFIEMHFERIDARCIGNSAARITDMLKDWGYTLKWVDPSHLHAAR